MTKDTSNNKNNTTTNKNSTSIPQAFAKLWTEEQFHDVTLKANDGVTVTANRAALATRSEVFAKMLYGNFSEASGGVVAILGCNGLVLRAVVEYIHTDTAQIFAINLDAAGRIHALVELSEAAEYFDLPLLCEKARVCLEETIDETPSLGIELLKACDRVGQSVPKDINILAHRVMTLVRFDVSEASTNILSLSPSVLKRIIKFEYICMDEIDLFRMLKLWAEADHATKKVSMDPPEKKYSRLNTIEGRKAIALDLKKHIRLERIHPTLLSEFVALSNLVTQDELLNAYKAQALSSKDEEGCLWERSRLSPRWRYSKTKQSRSPNTQCNHSEFEGLIHTPITSGKHQWTLQPEGNVAISRLGIFSTVTVSGRIASAALYSHRGVCYSKSPNSTEQPDGSMPFAAGSKVTFTLDLLADQAENGILSISIDGGVDVKIFKNLKSRLSGKKVGGFYPVVQYARNPDNKKATVQLLSIKKL